MNDYEARRQAKIQQNQVLLAGLDVKPLVPIATRSTNSKPPPAKRRRIQHETAPSRTSARIAAAPEKSSYHEDEQTKTVTLPRSVSKKSGKTRVKAQLGSRIIEESLVPVRDVAIIQAGWTAWESIGVAPKRDAENTLHFADFPAFMPNKSPEEMLREGCFGGSYYRALRSRKLGITIQDDWKELPSAWTSGLDPSRSLTSPEYDAEINKYKVSCGQSIEEWEAAGWISHEHDVRGWFQWYTRFYLGRRCSDDDRQVSRWRKCVGETGRWRRMLLKKYRMLGVREVFDDGAEEDAPEVSPVMHQTCFHWGWEIRQGELERYWAEEER
ncbi:hypothetical protein LTR08_007573 [Meristemomyces frigidus]|nr:hypothetical protein LTR08_007573 [Meristemomyces frigidus]